MPVTGSAATTSAQAHTPPPTKPRPKRRDFYLAAGVVPIIVGVVWASQVVTPTPIVHDIAKFGHLAFLIIGFGSVLAVDWYGLQWRFGQASLRSVVMTAGALAFPAWLGLAGLLVTGIFLEPDLTSPLTNIKIGFVTLLCFVGLIARSVQRELAHGSGQLRIFRFSIALAMTSQVCWWGAVVIGFLNRT